jgi:hypothetical protein
LDQTISNIKDKFIGDYFQNKKTRIEIDNIKFSLNNKINEFGDKINEGQRILETFANLLKDIHSENSKIKNYIIENMNTNISFDTFRNFIKIPEKEEHLLKLLSMEVTLEDMISCVKKFYERNILKYEESSKFIRKISKEIFIINFLKEKYQNN